MVQHDRSRDQAAAGERRYAGGHVDSTSVLRKGPGVPWCGTGPIEKAATEKVAAAAAEAAEQAAAMQAATIIAEVLSYLR